MPGKKAPTSLLHGLVHPLGKTDNQVCQRRNFDAILITSMRIYPAVAKVVALILRVVLLGIFFISL